MINLLYSLIEKHIKKNKKIRIFENHNNFNSLELNVNYDLINKKDFSKIRKILFNQNVLNYELSFNFKSNLLILDIYNKNNSFYHIELSYYNLKQIYKNVLKIDYSLNKEKFLKINLIE